ncbi:hypothetical protein OIU74_018710 [Salix koriyanagi]|uniref:Uncharacterized protein n=1 Tax=Salix koriyanagi TaxID=2511006 RepID=A0A9Q0WSE7_9ROSI|nr:hypothetical protein OIU74_018710 [Salix koriyanagi]
MRNATLEGNVTHFGGTVKCCGSVLGSSPLSLAENDGPKKVVVHALKMLKKTPEIPSVVAISGMESCRKASLWWPLRYLGRFSTWGKGRLTNLIRDVKFEGIGGKRLMFLGVDIKEIL